MWNPDTITALHRARRLPRPGVCAVQRRMRIVALTVPDLRRRGRGRDSILTSPAIMGGGAGGARSWN